jgi:hypothetical protein
MFVRMPGSPMWLIRIAALVWRSRIRMGMRQYAEEQAMKPRAKGNVRLIRWHWKHAAAWCGLALGGLCGTAIAENESTPSTASDSQGLSAEFRAKLIIAERAITAAQLAYYKAVITPAMAHGAQPVELASPPVGPGSNTRLPSPPKSPRPRAPCVTC